MVLQQPSLQSRRSNPHRAKVPRERVHLGNRFREEPEEHHPRRFNPDQAKLDMNVCPSGADQSRVEALAVVRRHEQRPTLLRRHPVNRVQQAGKADTAFALALREDRVDILASKDRVLRGIRQSLAQLVIAQTCTAQIKRGNVTVQLRRDRTDERRLTRSRRTVEQIAASPRHPALCIPSRES